MSIMLIVAILTIVAVFVIMVQASHIRSLNEDVDELREFSDRHYSRAEFNYKCLRTEEERLRELVARVSSVGYEVEWNGEMAVLKPVKNKPTKKKK